MPSPQTNFHLGHRQRVKERFLQDGLEHFAPHEVLELLLFYAVPQRDTNVLAHRLLDRFSTLTGVLTATREELCAVEGIGEHAATLLHLILPLASQAMTEIQRVDKDTAFTVDRAGEYLIKRYLGESREVVYLLLFDNSKHLLDCVRVYEGSVNSVSITPRMLIEIALSRHAASVILAHNHPNGLPIPSTDDINTTHLLENAFNAVGILFAEHVVVAGASYTPILTRMRQKNESGAVANRLSASPYDEEFSF